MTAKQPRFRVVCLCNGKAQTEVTGIPSSFKPKTLLMAERERAAWQAHADAHRKFIEKQTGKSYHYAVEPVNG